MAKLSSLSAGGLLDVELVCLHTLDEGAPLGVSESERATRGVLGVADENLLAF